ncbi:MAG: hypothetical protein ABSH51_21135 [Solirubrobacteraceae bacterium]|jgi:hypothetical protein
MLYWLPRAAASSARHCWGSRGDVESSADPGSAGATWTVTQLGTPARCPKYACDDDSVTSVSCPSDQFCAATDGARLWVTSDPLGGSSAWTESPLPITGAILSCPSPTLCVAVSASTAATTVKDHANSPGVITVFPHL